MKLKTPNKILFITLSNIGDVILTLPVLSALKDNFPHSKIDVVVGPRAAEIFIKDVEVDRIFIYDKHDNLNKKIDFIKKLRREKYDLAIDMRMSLIPILIGAKERSTLISISKSKSRHKKSVHLDRLKPLGIEYRERCNIYIDNKDREFINRLLEGHGVKEDDGLIGVSPACRSPLKQWRTEGFIEVIKALLFHKNFKIVLIGDVSQKDISKKIRDAVNHKNLIDLTGKTDLNQLFALIERMRLLLTGDSACIHIACDLGVRVVAIFGPTDPAEYGPTGKDDIVIRKKLKCLPCNKARCRFNHECMKLVDPIEVLEAVEGIFLKSAG